MDNRPEDALKKARESLEYFIDLFMPEFGLTDMQRKMIRLFESGKKLRVGIRCRRG